MRSFLCRISILLFLVAALLLFSLFCIHDSGSESSLLGALRDKHALLARTTGPRVILIGGSNVSFGIDSRVLSAELRMPVVNMALHGGLGLKYTLDDCLPYVHQGDIVLLMPEYENYYTSNFLGELELVSVLFDIDQSGIKYISAEQWRHLLPYLPTYSAKKLKNLILAPFAGTSHSSQPAIYDRNSFNEYGDACLHWNLPDQNYLHGRKVSSAEQVNDEVISYLMKFKEQISQRHAACFLFPPAIDSTSFSHLLPMVDKISSSLRRAALRLAGNPARYALPDPFFFNSYYHLNKRGVDLRTKLVLEDIRIILPLPQNEKR